MRPALVVAGILALGAATAWGPGAAGATSCGVLVGQPDVPPAYRVDLESGRRSVVYGRSLILVLRYTTNGGACALDPPVPQFRVRPDGDLFFRPVEMPVEQASVGCAGCLPTLWRAAPTVTTAYVAVWHGAVSNAVVVGVRPALALRRSGRTGVLTVRSERSYAGRIARVEAPVGGRWRPAGRVRIDGEGTAAFRLPRSTAVRVRVPAIPGYLPAARMLRLAG